MKVCRNKITREELTTYEDYYLSMLKFKCERGINASSIADISGIPRATVIRKLRTLEKKGFIRRNKKLEYTLGQAKNLKAFQTNYLINQKNLSDFCTTLFNLMKNSKFNLNHLTSQKIIMEIAKTIAPVCLAIIMFGLGLGLTTSDF